MTNTEVAHQLRLKFVLGEICLGTYGFRAAVRAGRAHQAGAAVADFRPFDKFPDGIHVVQYPSHPTAERLPRLAAFPGMIRYVPHQYRRYSIDLNGTYDDYLKKFSSKSRFTLKKKMRRFKEYAGDPIRWRTYRKPEEMQEFYQLARQVSQTTYQERLLKAGLPTTDEYQRELIERAENGTFRGYILWGKDRPVAYLCCPIKDQVVVYSHVGYDPEVRQWSPGVVLLLQVLEQVFAEQCFHAFDFTQGEGPLKEFFANQFTECADIYFFRRDLGHLMVVLGHSSLDGVSRCAGRTLERIGLKGRVRDLIRSRLFGAPPAPAEVQLAEA